MLNSLGPDNSRGAMHAVASSEEASEMTFVPHVGKVSETVCWKLGEWTTIIRDTSSDGRGAMHAAAASEEELGLGL